MYNIVRNMADRHAIHEGNDTMPRVYFGFDAQSVPGEHIFLSYSRRDADRIKGIAWELHRMGLPIWYDDGLIPGNLWENEILENVMQSRLTVFFLTENLFKRDTTYMHDEFQFATDYKKPTLCIWLDNISNMDCTKLSRDMYLWWKKLRMLHSIEVFHLQTDEEKSDEVYRGLCRADRWFMFCLGTIPLAQLTESETERTYDVYLLSAGEEKIKVIKTIREITGLGLRESKNLVDSAPILIKKDVPESVAFSNVKELESVGASLQIKKDYFIVYSTKSLIQSKESENKYLYDVYLVVSGEEKIKLIKIIREITGLGLRESKNLVDSAPSLIIKDVPEHEAFSNARRLESVGARVQIVKSK